MLNTKTTIMKLRIKKRDIAFFFIGILFIFLVDLVINWNDNTQAFKDGFNAGLNNTEQIVK